MNKLKWYDFLGALILLFSVTKSAIKPPEVADHSNSLLPSSAPTTIAMDFLKIVPREAALPQIDMLSLSTSGIFVGNSSVLVVQDKSMGALYGGVAYTGSNPATKSLPKAAPRVETYPDRNGDNLGGFRSHTLSLVPVFIR